MGGMVAGNRGIAADTGLDLSRFFGNSECFWTGLQLDHIAALAKDALAETLTKIQPWPPAEINGAGVHPNQRSSE